MVWPAAPLLAGIAAGGGLLAALAALIIKPRETVPLINLAAVDIAALRAAASGPGVFRIANHGVDNDLVLNASRQFFLLPEEIKRTARSASGAVGGFQRGYIPLGGESGLKEFIEVKEGFCYGKEPDEERGAASSAPSNNNNNSGLDLLISPNAWPDDHYTSLGSEWVPTMLGFVDDCITMTNDLLAHLSTAMGREKTFLSSIASGGEDISLMRLFHYFPNDTRADLSPGVPRTGSSPHTDWHLLTIILQDLTGGLQVRSTKPPFHWIDVPANPGELIILVGDFLHALSDGRFYSPIHRVNLPPSGEERFSFTYFRYPHYDALVPMDAAKKAAKKARRDAERRRRAMGEGKSEAFNTLVRAMEGPGVERLATRSFGDFLLEKWNVVASNKVDSS